jgi:hypothetical protein
MESNGSLILGAASASYTMPGRTTSDNGTRFNVVVTDSKGTTIRSADAAGSVSLGSSKGTEGAASGILLIPIAGAQP